MSDALEQSFVQQLKANQNIIHKICRLYTAGEDAHKDLFQEITIQLWKAFPKFRGDSKFSTWAYRVALNTAITLYRKSTRSIQTISYEKQEFFISQEDYNFDSTGGQTYGISDQNDYFKKTTATLKQVATSFKFNLNGLLLPITSQYNPQDTVYTFPFTMGTTNNSLSSYTTSIPSVLYQNRALDRTNLVDGWGTLITPYGTFANALRMNTTLVQNDTISLAGTGLPRTIRTTRELKWFDASKKYPLMIVTQNSVGTNWVTTNVQFLDVQTNFQTNALFFYTPLAPTAGATVNFQNLSTNATIYSWDFGDPASANNTSVLQNPEHIFANNGVYTVTLTAINPGFTNTITQLVIVGDILNVNNSVLDNFKIAPNPFKDKINVIGLNFTSDFELYNFEGKLIYNGNAIQNQDFSGLPKGVYLLKVKNADFMKVLKLIKE